MSPLLPPSTHPLSLWIVSDSVNCLKIRTPGGNCRRNSLDAQIMNIFQRWRAVLIDFGAYQPAKGYKMLVEIGPAGQTGVPSLQAGFGWIPSLAGTPAGYVQVQPGHRGHSLWDGRVKALRSSQREIKPQSSSTGALCLCILQGQGCQPVHSHSNLLLFHPLQLLLLHTALAIFLHCISNKSDDSLPHKQCCISWA